jgi:hypothetical protein
VTFGSTNHWVVSSFGVEWRISLVTQFEDNVTTGPSRADLVGSDCPIAHLLYAGFNDSGALNDDIAVSLLRIYGALTGEDILGTLTHPYQPTNDPASVLRGVERTLADALYDAVELGRLRFERTESPPWPFLDNDDVGVVLGPQPVVDEVTTFVALRLLDQTGKAVPRRGFAAAMPDESAREGFLDAEGRLRIDGVAAGTCRVTFTDLDSTDFSAPQILTGRRAEQEVGPVVADAAPGIVHRVEGGETASSIAERFGFLHFATIWSHASNARLRAARSDSHVLLAGDEIVVPAKRTRTFSAPTGRETTLTVFTEELHVKLRAVGIDGAHVEVDPASVLVDDGEVAPVAAGGVVDVVVPRDAKTLAITPVKGTLAIEVEVGTLPPLREAGGAGGRLENLGFGVFFDDPSGSRSAGGMDVDDDDALELAIELFNESLGKPPSAELTDAVFSDLVDRAGA